MAWKEYKYEGQMDSISGSITYRPVLEVELSTPAKKIKTMALVDSGSESILINESFAQVFHISLHTNETVRIGGIGGEGKIGHRSSIKIKIEGYDEAVLTDVIFVPDLPFDVLLGQRGFFDRFDVRFEKKGNRFFLEDV